MEEGKIPIMIEITSIEQCSFQRGDRIIAALGFFDGIHRAHQRLIDECKERAKAREGKSVIFTFQNHPSSILDPSHPTPLLTPYPLKRQIIQSLRIDAIVAVPFDESLCQTPAQDFIDRVLIQKLAACELIAGFNFRFGFKRLGSVENLLKLVPDIFERVTIIDQQFHEGIPISSSRLRQVILDGNLQEASALLGRPYIIAGEVERGDGRGRSIGYPTANLSSEEQILPPNGVYGVRVRLDRIDASPYWGVMNVGTIPTFTDQSRRTVEIHILDFSEAIYNRYLIVEVMEFIRSEKKFPGVQELVQQIQTDIDTFRSSRNA